MVPTSPGVHSFIFCDVDLEPSYRGILYALDGKYDGTAKSVSLADLLAELAINKSKLYGVIELTSVYFGLDKLSDTLFNNGYSSVNGSDKLWVVTIIAEPFNSPLYSSSCVE
jgi:hypothetical protein